MSALENVVGEVQANRYAHSQAFMIGMESFYASVVADAEYDPLVDQSAAIRVEVAARADLAGEPTELDDACDDLEHRPLRLVGSDE